MLLLLGKKVVYIGVEEGVGVHGSGQAGMWSCGGLVGEEEELNLWCDPFDPCGYLVVPGQLCRPSL